MLKWTILTEEIIESGRSRNGGWSLKQLKILGVEKFERGWKRKITGRTFLLSEVERFIALKDQHLKVKIKRGS